MTVFWEERSKDHCKVLVTFSIQMRNFIICWLLGNSAYVTFQGSHSNLSFLSAEICQKINISDTEMYFNLLYQQLIRSAEFHHSTMQIKPSFTHVTSVKQVQYREFLFLYCICQPFRKMKTEHRVSHDTATLKGENLSQGPNSGSLTMPGFEITTFFLLAIQRFNC